MKPAVEFLSSFDEMELPDLRGKFVELDTSKWGGEKPPCCAIGGANVAARRFEFEVDEDGWLTFQSRESARRRDGLVDFSSSRINCPYSTCVQSAGVAAYAIIIHLYDYHLWSRTQIADYLDTILTE